MVKVYRQMRNDEKDIQAVADGYKTKIAHELWLVDGVQKDAVQNSWDARVDKKHGKEWECGFSILDINNKNYLCVVDHGTHGLNGNQFDNEEELKKILLDNKRGEDLAYFLNSNWSAKSGEEGGNRGRGKTLFIVASQDKKIFFDSLRNGDGKYIFGELYLDFDKQMYFQLHYNKQGEERLSEITNSKLLPLSQPGTRVLISNPESSIVAAIKSGEILSFIANSRWEIIKKLQARIFVDNGTEKKYVSVPPWYEDESKGIPEKVYPSEIIKEGTNHRIKKLVLRYAPDLNLPESIKGIAIQRGGMTIERLAATDLVKEEGMGNIYGWAELDTTLEKDIKEECEGAEHFDFSWNTNPAKSLKDYIRSKVRDFAKELKIIETELAKKNKIQKEAEEKALKSLSPLFKRLGLFGKRTGTKARGKHTRKENELLRLSIADIKFPRDSRRVNYDEIIEGTYVTPINELSESILVLVRIFIVSDDGQTTMLDEKEINLQPGSSLRIGPEMISISKNFRKGGYSLRARMVSLEETQKMLSDGTKIEKGTIIYDRINKKFFVEIDPPEAGPFRFQPKPKEDKEYLLSWEEDDDGYIIYYNSLHPKIKVNETDLEKLSDYLTEQGALIAFQIKLEELIGEEDSVKDEFSKLIKEGDVTKVMPLILRKHSEFLWEYRKGSYGNKNN